MKGPDRHPHLGELVEARLKELGMTKAEFGRRIGTSRQNVSLILQKRSLDTGMLQRIGEVLDKDFFALLSAVADPAAGQVVELRLEFVNRSLLLVVGEGDCDG